MYSWRIIVLMAFLLLLTHVSCVRDQEPAITLNEKEYFSAPGFAFLLFHNNYQVGQQGGLQMIQHEERLLDSGDLFLVPQSGTDIPDFSILRRTVDRGTQAATIQGEVTKWKLGYQLVCRSDGKSIQVRLRLDRPVDWSKVRQAGFKILIYPGSYFQKSFLADDSFGVFPQHVSHRQRLAGPVGSLRIASEDPLRSFAISSPQGRLSLLDTRQDGASRWFMISSELKPGSDETETCLTITPDLIPNWKREPVLGLSQVGYHPQQPKRLLLELDPRDSADGVVTVHRLLPSGEKQQVLSKAAAPWGLFLRYNYSILDFTEIREPGLYLIEYRGQTVGPIQVSTDLYREIWKPTLEYFLPVQMCHVAVMEGNRTWHGACHLDDALQAPVGKVYIDGYRQGDRETQYADNEHVSGLDWGGWHDAGDNDIPAGSIAMTTLPLALAQEEFIPDIDQTSIGRADRLVRLNTPDGDQDLLQQIAFGAESLLALYQPAGHVFPGIIESSVPSYAHVGDTINITDNRVYDPRLKPDQIECNRSGKFDDRWVFTNRHTGLQYLTAQALAAASRVLRETHKELAEASLRTATKLWDYEQSHAPVYTPNSYCPRDTGYRNEEIAATVELLLTTGESKYLQRLQSQTLVETIRSLTPEQFGEGPGWTLVRALPKITDAALKETIQASAGQWKTRWESRMASNPYGVPYPPGVSNPEWELESRAGVHSFFVWGHGWDLQEQALRSYYFRKSLPDLFGRDLLFNVVNFVLGCHASNNRSFVSAVGLDSALVAYGFNRDDWTHIPGGVISGTSLVKPDFMELKLYPHLWYQTEYVISGAATFIFDVLVANEWLEK